MKSRHIIKDGATTLAVTPAILLYLFSLLCFMFMLLCYRALHH